MGIFNIVRSDWKPVKDDALKGVFGEPKPRLLHDDDLLKTARTLIRPAATNLTSTRPPGAKPARSSQRHIKRILGLDATTRLLLNSADQNPKSKHHHLPTVAPRDQAPTASGALDEEGRRGARHHAGHKEAARKLGRTLAATRFRREFLGKPPRNPVWKPWKPYEIKLLGTLSDSEVAKRTGHPAQSARQKQFALGIPLQNPRHRPWT